MNTTKMSLANMQGKLSRTEMKNIMAGSGSTGCLTKYSYDCLAVTNQATQKCCSGLTCVRNGTDTGNICM